MQAVSGAQWLERLSEKDSVLIIDGSSAGLRQPTSFRLGKRFSTQTGSLAQLLLFFIRPNRFPL